MVKQKLTNEEEKVIKNQLQQFIEPRTLPDVIRRALLMNKYQPAKYQIYIPKGDYDDEMHFIVADDALKALENNDTTDLDIFAIKQLLQVPKIKNRIDYEFHGLLTDVTNEKVKQKNIFGEDVQMPSKKPKLHEKTQHYDVTGDSKKPMKGLNPQPIVHENREGENDDTSNEGAHNRDKPTRRGDDRDSKGNEGRGISFEDDEDEEDY